LYAKKGHDVYIESGAYFRNNEIYDFVWGSNPYIKGRKSGERNAGDIPGLKYKKITGSYIRDWEIAHGFEGESDFPKIYISPSYRSGYKDVILVDTTVISTKYDLKSLQDAVLKLKDRYQDKKFHRVKFQNSLNPDTGSSMAWDGRIFDYDVYSDQDLYIDSLREYYNIMWSADGLISLHTGASHISSEIMQYRVDIFTSICLVTQWTIDRDIFFFPNIEYIKV